MFELKITGIVEAGLFMKNGWPTRVVSLIDPEQEQACFGPHHLILNMHDVETQASPIFVMPEREHVETVLNFTESLTDKDKLLVHCNMGVSRSTSVSCGILIQHGMTYEEAFHHVYSIRSVMRPNRRFIGFIDEIFGFNGKFLEFVNVQRASRRNPIPTVGLMQPSPSGMSTADMTKLYS